jgi:hypothetical protein
MAVQDNGTRIQYTATASQTVFPYPFEILDEDDITVVQNSTTLSKTTHYTVSGVGSDTGGNITFVTGATSGDVITIYRSMALSRVTNYQANAAFLESEVDADFDRLWMAMQQNESDVTRAIRASQTDSILNSTNTELAIPATRAGKVLGFDSTGALSYYASTVASADFIQATTTSAMAALAAPTVGDVVQTAEFSTGSGGGGTYDCVTVGTTPNVDLPNTYNIIVSTVDATKCFVLRVGGVANVRQFGATGDGVTNDVLEIQAAIDYIAAAGGGGVYMPESTYIVSASIEIKTGVKLRGDGWKSIIKLNNGSVASLTSIQSNTVPAVIYTDDSNITDFSLSDFALDGNDANNNTSTFWGVGLADCSQYNISNIKITDVYGAGFGTFFGFDFTINNCLFKDITGTTGNPGEGMYIRKSYNFTIDSCLGIDLDDHLVYLSGSSTEFTTDGVISGCVGINCGRTSNSSAFNALDGIRRCTFDSCHARDCKKGFTIVGTNDAVQDLTYNGCTAYDCDEATSPNGFSSSSSSGTRHTRVRMSNCKAYNSGNGIVAANGYGFNMQDIDDLTLEGCEGSFSNYDGCWVKNCDDIRITGRFFDNGQEATVTNRAGVKIENCDRGYVNVHSYNNDWGVKLENDATEIHIHGNLDGNIDGPYLKGATTASSCIFVNIPDSNSDRVPSILFGTAAPTTKIWGQGDIVYNTSPTAGGTMGWVCVTAGTPGTWKTFGAITV